MSPSERLIAVILSHAQEPYAIGTSDCITFATKAYEAWTGRDAAWAKHVGTYNSPEGAARLLRRLKAREAGDVFARHLEEIPTGMATMGDLVTHLDARGLVAMGVCTGEAFAARGERGLIYVSMTAALRAFRSV
jgi:hypothetical protein